MRPTLAVLDVVSDAVPDIVLGAVTVVAIGVTDVVTIEPLRSITNWSFLPGERIVRRQKIEPTEMQLLVYVAVLLVTFTLMRLTAPKRNDHVTLNRLR